MEQHLLLANGRLVAGRAAELTDEDESELDYYEFKQVVVRICDAKIPEDKRGGEPFENTLQAWLQLMFVPTFRRILKDKARGIGSKTL